jgi:hypothetical protein
MNKGIFIFNKGLLECFKIAASVISVLLLIIDRALLVGLKIKVSVIPENS